MNRNSNTYAPSLTNQQNTKLANGLQANNAQQYTIVDQQQQQATDKQMLANGSLAINGFQFQTTNSAAQSNTNSAKQCEIHHSLLQHSHHQRSSRSAVDLNSDKKKKQKKLNFCRAWLNKFPSRSKRIDVISRIFFPKMFALFNLVYWFTYLFREDDIVQA